MALKKSRAIVAAAMQDGVGNDLFSAWCEATNEPLCSLVRNADGSFAIIQRAKRRSTKPWQASHSRNCRTTCRQP